LGSAEWDKETRLQRNIGAPPIDVRFTPKADMDQEDYDVRFALGGTA
jgi:hypothetical protein